MKANDFLLAVETEEIPDWMIDPALADLKRLFLEALGAEVPVETYATPRRLVLVARQIPEKEPDSQETLTGPPVSAGEKAAEGFARKLGVDPAELKALSTPKGDYLTYTRKVKGRRTHDRLAAALPSVILGIPWPKTMTWTNRTGPRFIRPIRRIVALYGNKVVPFEIAGVKSGNVASGHRRLGGDVKRVTSFEDLSIRLRDNYVILDPAERRARIEQGIRQLLGSALTPLRVRPNPRLLNTLVHITEFPTPILGSFDRQYLALPEEVLVTVMQHHQKYFSVEDSDGRLAPHFIAVMNIASDEDGVVRHGNERVLRARFNDARFFWETDQKRPLADRVEELKHVTFYRNETYFQKTEQVLNRVAHLGGNEHARRAALLAKCDLTTELVKEFTELQGVVGGLYARAQGEPEPVWRAIYHHYDPVPPTPEGQIVALADRLQTLEFFHGCNLMPTGSKDPFALRRAALGVARILIEGRHSIPIPAGLRDFVLDRVRYYFREVRGYKYDEVNAVLAAGADNLPDAADRLEAISKVRPTPDFEPLAASFKRIRNILRQAEWTSDAAPDPARLEPGPERDLYDAAQRVREHSRGLGYQDVLSLIATLRPQVDLFFDKVLVMSLDSAVRNNRLAFLSQLLRDFSTIADFSEIVQSSEGGAA
jgi:glycyl-tRNA synthetase beta chain